MLPLFEGFEAGVPPIGWSHVDGGNPVMAWETSYEAYTGSYAALHDYDYSGTDNDFLVGPVLDLSGCVPTDLITFTYWEQNTWTSYYQGHYVVYTTNPNPTSPSDFVQIQEMGPGSSYWAQRAVSLSSLAGLATVRIAFRYYGYGADDWYVDDVAIEVN